jgi:hypothetical protein
LTAGLASVCLSGLYRHLPSINIQYISTIALLIWGKTAFLVVVHQYSQRSHNTLTSSDRLSATALF